MNNLIKDKCLMRTPGITAELVQRTYPGSRKPLTVKEVAKAILPNIKTFLQIPDDSEITLTHVAGAYNQFMENQGFEIGTVDRILRTLNTCHVAYGHDGFSEDELSKLVDIQVQWSPIGLIRSLSHEDRRQLPSAIYDLVRFDKYECLGNI